MDRISPMVFESPIKTCAMSLLAISSTYLMANGLQMLFKWWFPLEGFNEWARTYGDIVYAPIPGMDIVIPNSQEIAQEFLTKQPSSTAGCRFSYLLTHLMGWEWEMPLLQPGPHHSNQHKMLQQAIDTLAVWFPKQYMENRSGKKWAMNSLTGIQKQLEFSKKLAFPSFWSIYSLFCDSSPTGSLDCASSMILHQKSGTLEHCILYDMMEEFGEGDDTQDATSMLYLAASDTKSNLLLKVSDYLKLQIECNCLTQRQYGRRQSTGRPSSPSDKIVRGYFIPKGTVIPQIPGRMMLNDPKVWGDPEVFRPEQFLEPNAAQRPNPLTTLFSWGMCLPTGFECWFALRDEKAGHLLKTISLCE
ncbi:cytochrome P450 [Serendipita vermifera]|nr:cytochrome P450 [Serendipita vermifera]